MSAKVEIERKFLVSGDFRQYVVSSKRIIQGYLCADSGRTVRIRIAGEKAYITIKGPSDEKMWSRYEFEQEIPVSDAEHLLELCPHGIIEKVRHYVPCGGHTWEIDVFHGDNEGLTIAEIELASENETFDLPTWIGEEVTTDRRYYNSMLAQHPFSLK
jgi:CYTH domain-containing protein